MDRHGRVDRAIRGKVAHVWQGVAELARRQHGVVARRQLLAMGIGADVIDRWIATGRLHVIHRGVYAVGHARFTQRGLWMAAVLACAMEAVLRRCGNHPGRRRLDTALAIYRPTQHLFRSRMERRFYDACHDLSPSETCGPSAR